MLTVSISYIPKEPRTKPLLNQREDKRTCLLGHLCISPKNRVLSQSSVQLWIQLQTQIFNHCKPGSSPLSGHETCLAEWMKRYLFIIFIASQNIRKITRNRAVSGNSNVYYQKKRKRKKQSSAVPFFLMIWFFQTWVFPHQINKGKIFYINRMRERKSFLHYANIYYRTQI